MSRFLRIGLVAEGPGDFIVLNTILGTKASIVPRYIQPELDEIGGGAGETGAGWKGVKTWCDGIVANGGLDAAGVLLNTDFLVIHLDAEVAFESEVACADVGAEPSAASEALRAVVAGWLGGSVGSGTVLCIPAQDTDAWVFAALFPDAPECAGLELLSKPAKLLVRKKVLKSKGGEPKKAKSSYLAVAPAIANGWPAACVLLGEAKRFDEALDAHIAAVDLATSN